MTEEAFASLKSSIFYIFLSLLVTPLIFWTKVSQSEARSLLAENTLFLVYLLFFVAAVIKGYSYRSMSDEREYIRTLQIKEVLYEEEIKLNRKVAKMAKERKTPVSNFHPDESEEVERRLEKKEQDAKAEVDLGNICIRLDYQETSPWKEVVFNIIDRSKVTDAQLKFSRGAENIDDEDLRDERHMNPVDTDHRPMITEN